jgi:hypothetical protein
MIKEEICTLIKEGKEIEAAAFFKENGIGSSKDEILGTITERKYSSKKVYDLFLKVANCIASESVDTKFESTKKIKEYFNTFIPPEFTDNWGSSNDNIAEYLESTFEYSDLFEKLWIGLKIVNESDVAIGAAWTAFLYLSV